MKVKLQNDVNQSRHEMHKQIRDWHKHKHKYINTYIHKHLTNIVWEKETNGVTKVFTSECRNTQHPKVGPEADFVDIEL